MCSDSACRLVRLVNQNGISGLITGFTRISDQTLNGFQDHFVIKVGGKMQKKTIVIDGFETCQT